VESSKIMVKYAPKLCLYFASIAIYRSLIGSDIWSMLTLSLETIVSASAIYRRYVRSACL